MKLYIMHFHQTELLSRLGLAFGCTTLEFYNMERIYKLKPSQKSELSIFQELLTKGLQIYFHMYMYELKDLFFLIRKSSIQDLYHTIYRYNFPVAP